MTARSLRETLLEKLGADRLRKVEAFRVGIAGAGGLGSNCAACLVRAGFRKLDVADFDVVEPANLDRQYYFSDQAGMNKVDALAANLRRINPDLELTLAPVRLEPNNVRQVFRGCDAVVECLDRAESKSMLVNGLLGSAQLIVAVSGLGGFGSSDAIQVRRIRKDLWLVGDLFSDVETSPALAPRVMIAAAKQADLVLEFVLRPSGDSE